MSPANLSASEAARVLARSRGTIAEAFRAGAPRDLPGLVRWLEAKAGERARAPLERRVAELEAAAGAAPGSDTSEASERAWRARKRAAEAELRELELAQRRGELIRRVDVVETWSARIVGCKARLRAVPKQAVTQIPGFTRSLGVALGKLIDETLAALAGDGLPPPKRGRSVRAPAEGDAA